MHCVDSQEVNAYGHVVPTIRLPDLTQHGSRRIRRREHFRTISILCFPKPGILASEILGPIEPKLNALKSSLPPGYQLQIGGEKAKQVEGFSNLSVVLLISLAAIYLALLLLVPVFYAIFVLDLKLIKWEVAHGGEGRDETEHPDAA